MTHCQVILLNLHFFGLQTSLWLTLLVARSITANDVVVAEIFSIWGLIQSSLHTRQPCCSEAVQWELKNLWKGLLQLAVRLSSYSLRHELKTVMHNKNIILLSSTDAFFVSLLKLYSTCRKTRPLGLAAQYGWWCLSQPSGPSLICPPYLPDGPCCADAPRGGSMMEHLEDKS